MSKRLLAIILSLVMVLGTVPALALLSAAAPLAYTVTEYGNVVLTDLAYGKTTTTGTGTSGANAVDNNTGTYVDIPWSTDNGATLSPNCWVTVDLGQEYHIDNVQIANYWSSTRYYHFDIYGSTDNVTWTLIAQKTDDAHSKQMHSFAVDATVRYVKEVGTFDSANTGYHFAEIQVYSNDVFSALEKGWDCGNFTASLSDAGVLTLSGTGAVGDNSTSASDYPWYSRMADVKELVVEDGITSLGQRSFSGYSNLAKITLGKDVTALKGMDVFQGGHSKEFIINGTLTEIGQGAVYGTTVDKVTLAEMNTPDFVRVCSVSSYNYNFVRGIALNGTNENYTWSVSEDGKVLTVSGTNVRVGKDNSTASSYPWYADYASTIEEIIVEPGVFVIGAHFADNYTHLKTVTLGPDVCYIYGDAFAHSKIETLNVQGVFTDRTTVISQGVFYDCGSVARVNLSEMTRYQFLTAIGKSSYNTDSVQSAKYGYNEINTRTADITKYNDGELSGGEFVFIVNVPNYDVHGSSASDRMGKMSYGSYLVRESAGGDTNLRWVLNITAGGTTRDYTISPKSYYDFSGYGSDSTNGSQILARFAIAAGNDCLPVNNGDVVTINSITVTDLEKGEVVLQSKPSTVGTFTVPADVSIPAKTYHTITWKLDDTVLYTATVTDGTVPTYPGEPLPEYKTENGLDYALVVPQTVAATEDATYTFTYMATSTVTATWLAPDGTVSATDSVLIGQPAHYTGPLANYTSGTTYYEYTIPGDGEALYEDTTYQITVVEHDTTLATLGLWGSGYENWGTPETQLLLRIWDWEGNEIPQIRNENGTDYVATPSSYYGAMIIRFEPRYWATPFIPHQGTSYVVSAKVYKASDDTLVYQTTNTQTITIANDFVPVHDHTEHCTSAVTTAADCIHAGERTYTCTDCGYTWTEEIPATGVHTYDEHGVCTGCGEHLSGDVSGDGVVDIADVTAILNYLRGDATAVYDGYADVSGDGVVNVSDVTAILDLLSV